MNAKIKFSAHDNMMSRKLKLSKYDHRSLYIRKIISLKASIMLATSIATYKRNSGTSMTA